MNTTLPQGDSHIFVCAAVADPRPLFVFRFNGERITSNSSKHTLATNRTHGTLTVFNAQGSDEGTYSCSASNRYGSVSTAAILTVEGKLIYVYLSAYGTQSPYIVSRTPDLIILPSIVLPVPPTLTIFPSVLRDVVSGETLNATCQANANPPPTIQWFRENKLLNDGGQISGNVSISQSTEGITTSSRLTVTGFTSQEAGVYSCVAVNGLGNDSRSFQTRTVGESVPLIPLVVSHSSDLVLLLRVVIYEYLAN